ncbi:gephyrin-like molybdotransferase Glp [Pseudemcibacter aquimaris]|uniref:molybdopterin molybdotransferase MoeA n=1 Tax=Pseudemcibacter aquimaris TaxID=2857064 RepID=UPI00201365A7|nr:gephyrin-like molybdotransferase Glp [Pseudemcibacter aquimaris]MCC3861019.1 molybdopterin molybdotransferase MoeA [Pseudemcibacter aquimaris]WDU59837.1 molybdopterin molybdotransferase MoeA [Pseudemcibacter aquimaris]
MSLLPVPEALETILNSTNELDTETIHLNDALGRVTANDITSNLTQPPFAASAMDGYAVKYDDIDKPLTVIGESQAGNSFDGTIENGEAARIFTGAPMVDGADTVVIQENVTRNGDQIIINDCKAKGSNIRAAGGDFKNGDVLVTKGTKIGARQIALLAAGNVAEISVYRQPKVAILSTGDELLEVGSEIGPDKIVNSNVPLFMALVEENGGIPINLGTAKDTLKDVQTKIALVKDVDIFVSIGGVSVGDYDIIQDVLKEAGLKVDFWKVAMQPGKPIVYGDFNSIRYFGMPGNPSSSYVCFANFMLPAMNKMQGLDGVGYPTSMATVDHDIRAGSGRMNYMRAIYRENEDGTKSVDASFNQGSARLKTMSDANCLLIRDVSAPEAKAGDLVKIVLI